MKEWDTGVYTGSFHSALLPRRLGACALRRWLQRNDAFARQIAVNAREFALQHLRMEDFACNIAHVLSAVSHAQANNTIPLPEEAVPLVGCVHQYNFSGMPDVPTANCANEKGFYPVRGVCDCREKVQNLSRPMSAGCFPKRVSLAQLTETASNALAAVPLRKWNDVCGDVNVEDADPALAIGCAAMPRAPGWVPRAPMHRNASTNRSVTRGEAYVRRPEDEYEKPQWRRVITRRSNRTALRSYGSAESRRWGGPTLARDGGGDAQRAEGAGLRRDGSGELRRWGGTPLARDGGGDAQRADGAGLRRDGNGELRRWGGTRMWREGNWEERRWGGGMRTRTESDGEGGRWKGGARGGVVGATTDRRPLADIRPGSEWPDTARPHEGEARRWGKARVEMVAERGGGGADQRRGRPEDTGAPRGGGTSLGESQTRQAPRPRTPEEMQASHTAAHTDGAPEEDPGKASE